MLKKILLTLMLSVAATELSYAKIIELNTHNADDCKKQLLAAGEVKPVIFMNIKGLKLSENLQPIYKNVSQDFPNKTFFTFTVDEKNPSADVIKTAQACIDAKSLDTPYVYAYIVTPTTKQAKGQFIAADYMQLSDNSTKQEIEKFLNF